MLIEIRLILKFMMWETKNYNRHIAQYISRSKGNQTMKLAKLKEYSMRKIFLDKLCTKFGGETIYRPFSKKSNIEHIFGSIVLCSLFLLYATLRAIKVY